MKTPPKNSNFWEIKNSADDTQADLLLYGEIDDTGWSEVTSKQFADDLSGIDENKTINLRVNSPGGDVFAGQAIYSMLKRCKNEVIGYVDGVAASIASLVLMACDKVIMPKNALIMIHKPWTWTQGNADELKKTAETLDKVEETLTSAYAKKSGLDKSEITEMLKNETWLNAEEAVNKGFADEIEDTDVKASLTKGILNIGGQNFNIKNYKNFKSEWFADTTRQAGEGKPDNATHTVKNIKTEKTQETKTKGKNKMDLKALCIACGLDYDALKNGGMTDSQIKALCKNSMNDGENDANDENEKAAAKAKAEAKAETDRVQNLIKLGEEYNAKDKAMEFIKNGKTCDQFKDELIKNLQVINKKPVQNDVKASFGIGMSVDEAKNFSFVKLINALTNPADVSAQKTAEKELSYCSKAAEKYGVKNKGTIIPAEVLVTPLTTPKSAINTTVGAPLIPTTLQMGSFIELLRNKTVILQLARQLNGLVGNIDIPKQTAEAQGYWVGEDTAPTTSNATFDTVKLRMKTVAGNTYVTRNMLKQTTMDMEAFVRQDLATALALKLDEAAFYGTGGENEPKGLANITGVNSVQFAGEYPTYTELVQMETEIAKDNADVADMAYIINAGTRGNCKTTQKFPDAKDGGGVIWEPENRINGYNAVVTNQIKQGDVFMGNFADFIVGLFGGLEILVDPYSYSAKGAIQVTGFQDVDFAVRHEESFCIGKKKATA